MALVFGKNIQATQLMLRIILNRDIEVISVEGEEFSIPMLIMSWKEESNICVI